MRIGVVGSRRRNTQADKELVFRLLDAYEGDTPMTLVSGGCKTGADHFAKLYSLSRGVELVEHLPNMKPKPYSRIDAVNRYMERNKKIAQDIDVLIALVADDRTGGTERTISYTIAEGVHAAIFDRRGRALGLKEAPRYD